MASDHCVYQALMGTDIVYYGYTKRFDDRVEEHLRAGNRLAGFSAKELVFGLGLRQGSLSFELVQKDMTRGQAQYLERMLTAMRKPLGNETFARPRR